MLWLLVVVVVMMCIGRVVIIVVVIIAVVVGGGNSVVVTIVVDVVDVTVTGCGGFEGGGGRVLGRGCVVEVPGQNLQIVNKLVNAGTRFVSQKLHHKQILSFQ